MARLILEERGVRRGFRLNDGKLSIGSAESCALTLSSPDVAEIHAELEIKGPEVILRPKPGVNPPTVLGKPITQPTRLPKGAEFRIGSAIFRLEPETHGSAAAPAVTPGGRRGAASGRAGSTTAAPGTQIEYRRRTIKRGMPTWAIFAIVIALGAVVWVVAREWLGDEIKFDPNARYLAAVQAFEEGGNDRALIELDRIDPELAGPELMAKVKKLREELDQRAEDALVAEWNIRGNQVLETQLRKYVDRYLQGDKVDRARARLFVKRCDDFSKRWPKHDDLDWVKRYRDRFAPIAELDDPSTLADVEWEVKRLTAGKPRDYVTVFGLLDEFLGRAGGADRDAALAITDTQIAERKAFHEDQMLQSRYHWRKEEYGKAIAVLVNMITMIGDEEMQRDAADAFLAMRTQEGEPIVLHYLRGYKRDQPDTFSKLVEIPEIRDLARGDGLL